MRLARLRFTTNVFLRGETVDGRYSWTLQMSPDRVLCRIRGARRETTYVAPR